MIILYLLVIPIICIFLKLILFLIVRRFGKFSYDGFSAAGFAYHPEKDIFYSTRNAWQKNFGYTHIYDVLAPLFRMIIDTEPIRFSYNDKSWLITFWKGQYGIVTGAEIGIYCSKEKKANKKTVYLPVSDNEMLDMELILYKNGKLIMKASSKHWWLAIFKLGVFSKPKELSMDIKITFPNKDMLNAFLIAFKKLGYNSKSFNIIDNTFSFNFTKPRTRKVWTRSWITDGIRQHFNHKNVKLYNKYLIDLIDDNRIDDSKTSDNKRVILVNDLLPNLLKNNNDNVNSKQITKKILSVREENIVFLNGSVSPGCSVNKYDEKIR